MRSETARTLKKMAGKAEIPKNGARPAKPKEQGIN
jgi:hypothetical protein